MGNASSCQLQGDPDLYGLGIRLGIYFQMLTIQASGLLNYVLREEDGMGEISVIFIFSVGTVLIRKLVSGDIEAVEAMFMIGALMGLANSYRSSNQLRSLAQLIYTFELLVLISIYVWFWWHGMDTLKHTCPDNYSFFFSRVSIWGWFRTFNKVLTVFAALAGAMMLVTTIIIYAVRLWHRIDAWNYRRQQRKLGQNVVLVRDEETTVGGSAEVDIALNVGVVVLVELAIRWNSIQGVNSLDSAGQFIPFFIALAQFLSVGYKAVANYMRKFADEEFDGRHPGHLEAGDQQDNALSPGPDGQPPCPHGKAAAQVHEEEQTHAMAPAPVLQPKLVKVSTA